MRSLIVTGMCISGMIAGCSKGSSKPAQPAVEPIAEVTKQATPTEVAMPRQLEADGWVLMPKATYTASQTPGDVTLVARGEAPTGGYTVKFVQSPLRIFPPQYMLYWKKPSGPVTQAITKFEATATFKATDRIDKVIVTDGAGRHEVPVDQARD